MIGGVATRKSNSCVCVGWAGGFGLLSGLLSGLRSGEYKPEERGE